MMISAATTVGHDSEWFRHNTTSEHTKLPDAPDQYFFNTLSLRISVNIADMKKEYRRTPQEMDTKEKRSPVSARIKDSTLKFLTAEASKANISVSSLIENVLDDYANWLKEQKRRT